MHSNTMITVTIRLLFVGCLVVMVQASTLAQRPTVEELSAYEKKALEQIDQRKVTATISFLASDELAGRGTGSEGFKIASSYMASRFRGAGLAGGGDDGGYFQVTDHKISVVPESGIHLVGENGAVDYHGLVVSGSEELSYSGTIEKGDPATTDEYTGPVWITLNDRHSGDEAIGNLLIDAGKLRRRGATAVLVVCDADHELVTKAADERGIPRRAGGGRGRRAQLSIPILLVDNTEISGEYKLELPAMEVRTVKVRNVIGVLKGSDPELSKEAVIFSAHLDHLGRRPGLADSIYNGADDNATGSTGVMELADAYGGLMNAPKRTTIFIGFWGEEMGLLGSRYYAENPIFPLDKTVAMINLEMIGRPETGVRNKTWMTGWGESNLGELMAIGAKRTGTIVFEHPQYSGRMLYGASDNYPLVQKGVVAHSFSAGSLHSDYHQQTDDWQKLDLDHMTQVIKGLFAGSLPIANGEMTPKGN